MRFSIRDVLWLTVVVGLALGWRVDNRNKWNEICELRDAWWNLRLSTLKAANEAGYKVRDLSGAEIEFVRTETTLQN